MGSNETLAFFSSCGPAIDTGLMKPDISAPGLFILSASNVSDTLYSTKSGTSMAAPHVTGAIALLISGQPDLTYDKVYSILTSTTDQSNFNSTLSPQRGGSDTCGGIKETVFPNNHCGPGRMNVFSAYQGFRKPTPAPTTPAPTTVAPTPKPTPPPTPAPTASSRTSSRVRFGSGATGTRRPRPVTSVSRLHFLSERRFPQATLVY